MQSFADIIKDLSVGDVHIAQTGQRRRRRSQLPISVIGDAPTMTAKAGDAGEAAVSFYVPISKIDDELRCVYGWASVNTEGGQTVTDSQGDQISDAEMTKAAHGFMADSRVGGVMHFNKDDGTPHRVGSVVESMVLTPDVQKALGVDLGKTGWFLGYHVTDPDAWALVKSKTLRAFSIGGQARRVPV